MRIGWCLVCKECGAVGSVNIVPNWHDMRGHAGAVLAERQTTRWKAEHLQGLLTATRRTARDVAYWHKTEMAATFGDVRYREKSRLTLTGSDRLILPDGQITSCFPKWLSSPFCKNIFLRI